MSGFSAVRRLATCTNDVAGTEEKWPWSIRYAASSRTVASPERTPARNVAEPKGPWKSRGLFGAYCSSSTGLKMPTGRLSWLRMIYDPEVPSSVSFATRPLSNPSSIYSYAVSRISLHLGGCFIGNGISFIQLSYLPPTSFLVCAPLI